MQMSVELLREKAGDDVREECDTILSEIGRLSFTLSELLVFAKPPSIKPQEVRVAKIIDETIAILRRQMSHLGIETTVFSDDDFPTVRADASALKQVLMNLVLNAMEAMPQGGAIEISAAADAGTWRLEVADTGKGFNPEDVEKLFEPFYTTKPGGTGLGLAVCRTLLDLHGGRISAEHKDGKTCFIITLPCDTA
jgi:two-component system sporulation sensor kinase C